MFTIQLVAPAEGPPLFLQVLSALGPSLAVILGFVGIYFVTVREYASRIHQRGDLLFARQLEALEAVSAVVATPINLGAKAFAKGSNLKNDPLVVDIQAVLEEYFGVASKHYWVLGPEMVTQADELYTKGFELLTAILFATDDEARSKANTEMQKHRDNCLKIVQAYVSTRQIDKLESKNQNERLARVVTEILKYSLVRI